MTGRLVVGLSGRKRSGKGEVASRFVAAGFVLIKFADPLKDMMRTLGLTEAEIEGDRKEVPSASLCGQTPRLAMQTLGTEWGRRIIGDTLWTDAWCRRVDALPAGTPVVVDDVRFPNEAALVKALGGVLVGVDRPAETASAPWSAAPAAHESEAHVIPVDAALVNAGTLAELHAAADRLVAQIRAAERERVDRTWAAAATAPPPGAVPVFRDAYTELRGATALDAPARKGFVVDTFRDDFAAGP